MRGAPVCADKSNQAQIQPHYDAGLSHS